MVLLAALTTGGEPLDCWGGGWGGGYCGYGYGGYCGYGYGYGGYCGYGYAGYSPVYSGYVSYGNGYYVARRAAKKKRSTAIVRARRAAKRKLASQMPRPKPAPATVVVRVPADAKLMVGDQVMKTTGARRVFVTTPLRPGKDHLLTLKASIEREGRTVTWEQDVTVRAKRRSEVTMTAPTASVAAR
jgi:uncharacterized protein (TIGR03000 family)